MKSYYDKESVKCGTQVLIFKFNPNIAKQDENNFIKDAVFLDTNQSMCTYT